MPNNSGRRPAAVRRENRLHKLIEQYEADPATWAGWIHNDALDRQIILDALRTERSVTYGKEVGRHA